MLCQPSAGPERGVHTDHGRLLGRSRPGCEQAPRATRGAAGHADRQSGRPRNEPTRVLGRHGIG
eukprot:13687662-Alexandrium_andersonii.AAC.1